METTRNNPFAGVLAFIIVVLFIIGFAYGAYIAVQRGVLLPPAQLTINGQQPAQRPAVAPSVPARPFTAPAPAAQPQAPIQPAQVAPAVQEPAQPAQQPPQEAPVFTNDAPAGVNPATHGQMQAQPAADASAVNPATEGLYKVGATVLVTGAPRMGETGQISYIDHNTHGIVVTFPDGKDVGYSQSELQVQ